MFYYSKSTRGFYSSDVHAEDIPPDAVEITDDYYQQLLEGQYNGSTIVPNVNGYPILEAPPPITKEQTVEAISSALEYNLDQGAKKWGYTSIVAAASYASSTNPQYAADAAALIQWRDDVWDWAIPLFPGVKAGDDVAAFIAKMPAQPAQPKP